MRMLNRISTAVLIALLLFSTAGCGAIIVGGAAAAGTYAYVNGQAQGTYNTTLEGAHKAALATCNNLSIAVTRESREGSSREIGGKYYGDSVTISMELVGDNLTEITVRVGFWGNESASRRIIGNISQRL